ncbi:Rqc2 family fibronectin-binding protein [Hippea alviniae]|uniref:Rqc2 family fibronectin-binding protein n=1 Tax=Hippea alviniae TaxID=1279027 RepID=UPI0003B630EF|nr:NFACT family protein [Hippea alviniae]
MNHYLFKYAIEKSKNLFLNKRISSITVHTSSLFSIGFKDSDYFLFANLSTNNSFIYPFKNRYGKRKKDEVAFFSFLKKKLVGCRLLKIEQSFSERVARFVFEDVRGSIVNRFNLIFEIMDRNTNAVITNDDGIVLFAFKSTDRIQAKKVYEMPAVDMPDLLKDDIDILLKRYRHGEDILGFGLGLRRLVKSKEEFVEFVIRLRDAFKKGRFELCKYGKDVYPFCFFEGGIRVDDNFLFGLFVLKPEEQEFGNAKNNLLRILKRRLNSLIRRLKKIDRELKTAEDFDKYRIYAENLMANPNLNVKYKDFVEIRDIYTSSVFKIPLNPDLDLFENAQHYFKKYKKAKNSVEIVKKRREETQIEIEFVEQLIFDLERASNYDELEDVRNIAIGEKIIREQLKRRRAKFEPYEHIKVEGFDAYVGKNARGNDIVALKLSSKNDLWFHAKNRPSAHLVLKLPSKLKDVSDSVKIEAAKQVACRTKAASGEKIEVDYTFVKNLRKPKGFKTGMVIYTNFKTITVEKNECN